ncbi:MAG: hypothetical protein ABR587_09955 [Candidatus Binatia bacterium]
MKKLRAVSAVVFATAALLAATPSGATFHFAHIERVLTGLDGTTDVQFVQIQMDALGQHLVADSKLIAFNGDGSFSHVVLTVPDKVESGDGASFLMASDGFEAETGMAPDFTFESSPGKGLFPKDGMVCWGKPDDITDPNDPDMVDCVSYGNYTGEPNNHTDAPSPIAPFGHGLVKETDTDSSAVDFLCEDQTTPVTNEPDKRSIDATSPCTGCGNYVVEGEEACDDGDVVFAAGDACSTECKAFSCGAPTNINSTGPKTADALFVLRAAVQGSNCELAVCDVNASSTVNTTDALLILRRAVGQDVILACPV